MQVPQGLKGQVHKEKMPLVEETPACPVITGNDEPVFVILILLVIIWLLLSR